MTTDVADDLSDDEYELVGRLFHRYLALQTAPPGDRAVYGRDDLVMSGRGVFRATLEFLEMRDRARQAHGGH